MFTLIYNNGELNRPSTMSGFVLENVGESPLLQIDCVTPFKGTERELIQKVCEHLSSIAPDLEVIYNVTQNSSTEQRPEGLFVKYLVIRVDIRSLNK